MSHRANEQQINSSSPLSTRTPPLLLPSLSLSSREFSFLLRERKKRKQKGGPRRAQSAQSPIFPWQITERKLRPLQPPLCHFYTLSTSTRTMHLRLKQSGCGLISGYSRGKNRASMKIWCGSWHGKTRNNIGVGSELIPAFGYRLDRVTPLMERRTPISGSAFVQLIGWHITSQQVREVWVGTNILVLGDWIVSYASSA